jgi:hypothetical protein
VCPKESNNIQLDFQTDPALCTCQSPIDVPRDLAALPSFFPKGSRLETPRTPTPKVDPQKGGIRRPSCKIKALDVFYPRRPCTSGEPVLGIVFTKSIFGRATRGRRGLPDAQVQTPVPGRWPSGPDRANLGAITPLLEDFRHLLARWREFRYLRLTAAGRVLLAATAAAR